MPPILERPPSLERRGEWRGQACFIGSRAGLDWQSERRSRRVRHGSPRRAWLAMNPRVKARVPLAANTADKLFDELASRWGAETAFESVVTRKAMHPAYQRIIGMGAHAVPLILERLRREPAQWFWALTAITGEDAAQGETTVEGAATAWLEWGRARGLVSD